MKYVTDKERKYEMPEIVNKVKEQTLRRYVAHEIAMAMQENNKRNKVICCDFIIEADTSPQDEFELFKYIYKHGRSEFEPYYIINGNCAAYPAIKAEYGDNIISYTPEKYYEFAFLMKDLFKTVKFICGGFQVLHSLHLGITEAVKRSPYVFSFFTQHGITFFKDDFISPASYSAFLFDKIMISNDFEKKIFMERACYKEKNLVKNGLFRWDLLSADNAERKKVIFIYFTHRRYLKNIEEAEVKNTAYVKAITNLLQNDRFRKFVSDNGYTLKVALHHSLVQICGNKLLDGVQIIEDDEIADVKKEASILITDYSSMCFEMFFQHKPAVFYNIPDGEDCLKYGHKTDLADPYGPKRDVIFNIVDSPDECMDKLEFYHGNGYQLTPDEKVKRDAFFYHNGGFCERFYNYLLKSKNDTKKLYRMPVNNTISFSRFPDIETYGIEFPSSFEGRWIVRKKAYMSFFVPASAREKGLAVQLYFKPYFYYKQYRIGAKISVNGHLLQTMEIFRKKNDYIILDIPKEYIEKNGKVKISFSFTHIYRRNQLKTGALGDRRRLSIRLLEMDIFEKDRSFPTAEEQLEQLRIQRAEAEAAENQLSQ